MASKFKSTGQFINSKTFKKLPRLYRIKKPGIYMSYEFKLATNQEGILFRNYACEGLIIVDSDMKVWKYNPVANSVNPYLNSFMLVGFAKDALRATKVEKIGGL